MTSLTAPERESVVNGCDADDFISIWTAQRPVITKLRKNPAATLVEWGRHGTSVWASFTMPAACLSFRSGGHVATRSHEELRKLQALGDAVSRPGNAENFRVSTVEYEDA